MLTGENPVTLTGHTRKATALAIVDRGRNVLSAAWDGTVRLWDCGTAACLATVLSVSGSRFTAMALCPGGSLLAERPGASPARLFFLSTLLEDKSLKSSAHRCVFSLQTSAR